MKRTLRLLLLRLLALAARAWVLPRRATIARVLYLKPDHLGDILLATPVLAALRARQPQAHITAMVGPWSAGMLARNPDIDTILTCLFPGFERQAPAGGRLMRRLRPYVLLIHYGMLLRRGNYDVALIGRDDHWWGAALALLAGIPLRIGFAVPECRPFLSVALPWNAHDHVTAQGLALVQALPGPPLPAYIPARFTPAPADHAWAESWLRENTLAAERLVIIHPGTAGPDKLWFPERWAAVADELVRAGAQLVLTGGPGEEALVAAVAAAMHTPAIQLAGRTSVGQLAALLGRASLVLGVDSGPLHIAAAQAIPSIHLYGPGDAGRFGPWGDPAQHRVIRAELWCSPCGVFSACPRGLAQPECMQQIATEQVLAAARQLHGNHKNDGKARLQ